MVLSRSSRISFREKLLTYDWISSRGEDPSVWLSHTSNKRSLVMNDCDRLSRIPLLYIFLDMLVLIALSLPSGRPEWDVMRISVGSVQLFSMAE
jgi:hypothetical protein